jgi:ubiquinone/menaquinone biosynthesis C-methylase UbiE
MKLNLGCGRNIKKGYVNLDIINLPGVDTVCDIEKQALPFHDNYFDNILCDNVLEHIVNLENVLKEIHRVLKKDGIVEIKVPHFSSFCAYNDPTHKRFFGFFTFDYYTENNKFNFYSDIKFMIVKKKLIWYWFKNRKGKDFLISFLMSNFPLFYERFLCWILPVIEIHVKLKPVKK